MVGIPRTRPDAEAALRDVDDLEVHRWLQELTRSGSNPNLALADGLNLQRRYYLGPLVVSLSELVRCCGPEPGMPYPDPEINWQRHILRLAELVDDGWTVPLLADGTTHVLMDGNHRFGALRLAGRESHPVIFMFNSDEERSAWVAARRDGSLAEPLRGGHTSDGVVRIGRAVRRPAKPSTPFVAQLLSELEKLGFPAAPRFLGIDGLGREALTHVPGVVLARGQHSLEQVHAVAKLLSDLHTVTASSDLARGRPIVCHGDPKPRNTVFSNAKGTPVAFIDFDCARPGDPLEDVHYLAWMFALNSYPAAHQTVGQQRDACIAVCDGYGLSSLERRRLIDGILTSQRHMLAHATNENTARWVENELRWARAHGRSLAPA